MKWFLNSLIFLCLLNWSLFAKDEKSNYIIQVAGIKIGELVWEYKIENEQYTNRLSLKSKGLLSSLYSFKGEYFSNGTIYQKKLTPKKYTHFWQTKKTKKNMELLFDDNRLVGLKQEPLEKEGLRTNVYVIDYTTDPLSSFIKIMMGEDKALVVDGRRLYTMLATSTDNKNRITIEISNYSNLWADHKRKKFEKLIFLKDSNSFFPSKIFIHFDNRVFKLYRN